MRYILVLTVVLILGFFVLHFLPPRGFVIEKENPPFKIEKEKTLFFVGDIMLDRGVELKVKREGGGDFKFVFSKIADKLKKADLLFGNLESVISDKGKNVGSEYSFRADPEAVKALEYAGFDVVSLAHNHALDYTGEALEDCMERLKKAGIDYVGAGNREEAFSLKIKEVKGLKVGFLAFTDLGTKYWKAGEESAGIAWTEEAPLEITREAKEKVDILAVSFHSGKEYAREPESSKSSLFKEIVDSGADLIIGHHPHVIQPVEEYKNGWIAYSLGNFVFDQSFSEETMEGLLLEVIIKGKEIKEVNSRKIGISDFYQPYFK